MTPLNDCGLKVLVPVGPSWPGPDKVDDLFPSFSEIKRDPGRLTQAVERDMPINPGVAVGEIDNFASFIDRGTGTELI